MRERGKTMHRYPVEVNRPDNNGKNKTKKLSRFQMKLVATIGVALIIAGPLAFWAADRIMHPALVKFLVEPFLEYDYLYPIDEELFIAEIYEDNGNVCNKVGIVNKRGEIVAPVIYDYIDYYFEDRNAFYVKNGCIKVGKGGKYGLLDTSGETIAPLVYDFLGEFFEGVAVVQRDDKWGYIDASGNVAIDLVYDGAHDFSEGLAMAQYGDKFGFINKTGETIIPFVYNGYTYKTGFTNGLMVIWQSEGEAIFGYGVIDKTGNVVVPFEYSWIDYISYTDDIYFEAEKYDRSGSGKTSIIDKTGEAIMEINREDYGEMRHLCEGLLAVQKEGKWGFLDIKGDIAVPFIYDWAENFIEGLAVVGTRKNPRAGNIGTKCGMVDKTGKEVVPAEYGKIINSGDLMLASKYFPDGDGGMIQKFGYLDRTGEEVIPLIYEHGSYFEYGLAGVCKEGKWGVIDETGDVVIEFIYERINIIDERLISLQKNGKWGIMDIKGEIALDFDYDRITRYHSGKFLCASKDGKWGILKVKKQSSP